MPEERRKRPESESENFQDSELESKSKIVFKSDSIHLYAMPFSRISWLVAYLKIS